MSNTSKMQMGMNNPGLGGLLKDGFKTFSGVDEAVVRNIQACKQMSAITKTSYGPNGMNKLVINHLERVFITSDTATIVEELEVEHPAAKLLCMAAKMQEKETGDGTNYVVTFAGELLEHAETLIREGVHVSDIVEGYRVAGEATMKLLDELVVSSIEDMRNADQVADALRSVVAAKHYGYEDLLTPLIAKACVHVMSPAPRKPHVNVDNVRVAKMIGCSVGQSQVLHGLVVQRDAAGTVKHVENAKIAVFGCSIEASSTETKGTVVIRNAEELKTYNKSEEKRMEEAIKAVADTGARVLVAGGSISEMAMHFIEKYNMLAVKIISKFELRRLCRTVGATACARLGAPMPEELGHAKNVSVQELSGKRVLVFQQDEDESGLATIVLRGSTMNLLDDMERAIDDAVNVVKSFCKHPRLLPGAGATEIALAHAIGKMGEAHPGLEQYSMKKFAEALEVFPRILAENSGQRATDTVSALYAAHAAGKSHTGVDVAAGGSTVDAVEAKVFDSHYVKKEAMRLAIDTAMTVLKVDQIIMSKKAGGPKPRAPQAPDM